MKLIVAVLILLMDVNAACAQTGCTDMQAVNYDPSAMVNDGSCIYPATTLALSTVTQLSSPVLDECSGHCIVNGKVWAHVDNTISTLYQVDSITGSILDSLPVAAQNFDWEDIQARGDYIYIGDVGNNWGNRTNLRILRFPAASLDTATLIIPDEIMYSYADQINFNVALNNNSFDCEAFLVYNDSIHLFTKDWINKITKHYVVPAVPGVHTAVVVDSFNVNGLVTSAGITNDSLIVLTCYNNTAALPVFMWMMYDFKQNDFFSGNRRRLETGSLLNAGQVEGVAFTGAYNGMLSSERFQQLVFNVPPRFLRFNLNPYLPSSTVTVMQAHHAFSPPYPNPAGDYLMLDLPGEESVQVTDNTGRTVLNATAHPLNVSGLDPGHYTVIAGSTAVKYRFTFVKQ